MSAPGTGRLSNGTECDLWMGAWCRTCVKDKGQPDDEHNATLHGGVVTVREFITARLDEEPATTTRQRAVVDYARRVLTAHGNEEARTTADCRASECCWDGCLITYCEGCGQITEDKPAACDWLLRLAAIWSDHHDYQPEWKVPTDDD